MSVGVKHQLLWSPSTEHYTSLGEIDGFLWGFTPVLFQKRLYCQCRQADSFLLLRIMGRRMITQGRGCKSWARACKGRGLEFGKEAFPLSKHFVKTWAGEMAQAVKCLLCKHGPEFDHRTQEQKPGIRCAFVVPELGRQNQEEPWSSLINNQPSLLSERQVYWEIL